MLTEQAILETSKRRTRPLAYALACMVISCTLLVLGFVQLGETARDYADAALLFMLLMGVGLIVVILISFARHLTICPSCNKEISHTSIGRLLATKRCPSCNDIVVAGGRPRSAAVYKRYMAIRTRSWLKYWLWLWPALGFCALALWFFDRTVLEQCPQHYVASPLIGASTAGWAWLRTFDLRYFLPFGASIVLLGVGATVFWQTLNRAASGW